MGLLIAVGWRHVLQDKLLSDCVRGLRIRQGPLPRQGPRSQRMVLLQAVYERNNDEREFVELRTAPDHDLTSLNSLKFHKK